MSRDALKAEIVSRSETVITTDGDFPVVIDDGALLFGATFQRAGPDLLLLNDDAVPIRIVDYFRVGTPDLASGGGGLLRGATVEILAGPAAPGQYAQTRLPDPGLPIGQVETLEGSASVQRADGTMQPLRVGMKVFQNDVVATEDGSGLSLTFADGTIFSLASSSRMVLDHLIYDPAGSANSAAFSLVQGSFVFIAGQVARTGGMEITTPAATMGIRGTTVRVDVTTFDGETTVECTLNRDPDGGLGKIEIFDLDGTLVQTVTGTDFRWLITTEDQDLVQIERSPADVTADTVLLDDAFAAFRLALRRVSSGQTFVDLTSPDRADPPADATDPNPPTGFNTGAGQELSDDPGPPPAAPPGAAEPVDEAPPILPTLPPPPVDTAPDADDTFLEIDEDTRHAGVLTGRDADGDVLTWQIVEGPQHGTVTLAADGSYTYDPAADFAGYDSFTYAALDDHGHIGTGFASVTVLPVNDAPVLSPSPVEVDEDGTLSVDLATFADDVDAGEDGTTLTYTIRRLDDGAPDGEVALTGSVLTFTPGADFQTLGDGDSQLVRFDITATDAAGASTSAELAIAVTGRNDAPEMTEGAFDVAEDSPAVTFDLSALAFDAEDGAKGLTFALERAPEAGSAWIDGSVLTFAPGDDFQTLASGETDLVTLDVSATDSDGASVVQQVAVTVTGVDDAPAEGDGTLLVTAGRSLQGQVAAEGRDGGMLGFSLASEPTLGTLDLHAESGAYTYTPDAGAFGADSFEITVTDGNGGFETIRIAVAIGAAPTLPGLGLVDGDTIGRDAIADLGAGGMIDLSGLATSAGQPGGSDPAGALVATPPNLEPGGTDAPAPDLADILDADGGSDLETLLDTAAPLLDASGDPGNSIATAEPQRSDGQGESVALYDVLDGAGDVLATLAFDADIAAHTAAPAA